ncbi:cell division protein FtsA [Aquifex pyrophilus]
MNRLAALDVGSEKVVYLIGERDSYGDIHIIGFGEVPSRGIKKGIINDLAEAKKSILEALKEAEEMAGVKVRDIIYGVSGGTTRGAGIKSQNVKDTISIPSTAKDIDETHISRLIDRCLMKSKEDGYEIVYYTPRKYVLDEHMEVESPLGLEGSKLSVEVHVVKASLTILRNLEKAIMEVGLNPVMRSSNAIASAEAVLTREEKEEGVLLIDMGAGLTDYTLYIEGSPYITGVVPFGGMNITKDLSFMLKINIETAEKLKKEVGEAFLKDEGDETVNIKPKGEDIEIPKSKREIVEIIYSRVEEIIDYVIKDIKEKGGRLELLNNGIVITGGSAKLKGLREAVEHITGLPVRIASPHGIIGLKEKINDPKYSTAVGLLKQGLLSRATSVSSNTNSKQNGFLESIKAKLKNLFEELL